MYKTHVKQWGLDKKNKEPEMRAIVRKYKQRADQGKPSSIQVRGQIRTVVKAFSYWKRKGVSIDEIIARQTASPTPEAVKFFTPVPSPIMTPQVLAIPERMFRLVQDYFQGSFESGSWFSEHPCRVCRSIKDENNANNDWVELDTECQLACSLSKRKLSYEAEQIFNKAITKIKQILLADDPATINHLFGLIVFFRSEEEAEMALVMLRQFSVMGKALLGSEHPLSRICEWFDKVYESDVGDIAIRCIEIVTGQLESSVGPLHLSTLNSRINLIQVGTQNGKACIQKMQKLFGECENILRPEDLRVMQVRAWVADEFFYEGRYDDAVSLCQTNITHSQDQSSMNAWSYDYSCDLYLLAKCQHARGEVALGIATLHQAIDVRTSIRGTQDAEARYWLLRLEDWYAEQGLWDSAAVAQDLSLIALKSMDVA